METYFYRAPTMCFIIKGKEAGNLLGLSAPHVSKAGVTQAAGEGVGSRKGQGAAKDLAEPGTEAQS